jgi:hypothetical protein
MFVCTFRASGIKFFGIIALTLIVLLGLTLGGGEGVVSAYVKREVDLTGMKTREDRVEFLKSIGIEVAEGEESESFVLPENFDRVLLGYNEIQKRQGLDLSKYRNREVTRYTFTVTNYKGYEGTVLANVLVYRNRVIGGDVCSADVTGFVVGFDGK